MGIIESKKIAFYRIFYIDELNEKSLIQIDSGIFLFEKRIMDSLK